MKTRYSRQELFLGETAQRKIRNGRILIIGAGALGSSSAEMLARAGVGKITIVDRDYVEWSNLQRQHLFAEEHAEQRIPKAAAAKQRLEQINSHITIHSLICDIHGLNIGEIVKGHDLIIDASDNFEIRLIANDAAVKQGIPFVMGACVASYGTTFTVLPGETPCLHCLFNHLPIDGMTCETVGVISPIVQIITALQVTQVLKILTGAPIEPILKSVDVWKDERADIDVSRLKNADCPTCGSGPTYPYLQYENQTKSEVLCGREAVQIRPAATREFILQTFLDKLKGLVGNPIINPFLLSCEFAGHRIVFFKDGRAIVHGTNDLRIARTVYNRFLQYYTD
ncbi:ThiF family adenylyltransferase [Oceanobacillus alkalisoli]|uniref:ThiF family adenylyltransferase n=1 Tax=Oceanobacillus alkalisoli TaxID=2925113 RepID=UPI001EF045E4|nr:ThiF family adenylyltransferase [Oceanobacillus alkalisoli]MCF3944271.1 ThiF family adenylyltransferase [Oceanobacillus alkalisoli]MCG5105341.1 ThiF family adenylyltransferase [Oceanobacillus alkalisoli]